jgi:hypothetical protein
MFSLVAIALGGIPFEFHFENVCTDSSKGKWLVHRDARSVGRIQTLDNSRSKRSLMRRKGSCVGSASCVRTGFGVCDGCGGAARMRGAALRDRQRRRVDERRPYETQRRVAPRVRTVSSRWRRADERRPTISIRNLSFSHAKVAKARRRPNPCSRLAGLAVRDGCGRGVGGRARLRDT